MYKYVDLTKVDMIQATESYLDTPIDMGRGGVSLESFCEMTFDEIAMEGIVDKGRDWIKKKFLNLGEAIGKLIHMIREKVIKFIDFILRKKSSKNRAVVSDTYSKPMYPNSSKTSAAKDTTSSSNTKSNFQKLLNPTSTNTSQTPESKTEDPNPSRNQSVEKKPSPSTQTTNSPAKSSTPMIQIPKIAKDVFYLLWNRSINSEINGFCSDIQEILNEIVQDKDYTSANKFILTKIKKREKIDNIREILIDGAKRLASSGQIEYVNIPLNDLQSAKKNLENNMTSLENLKRKILSPNVETMLQTAKTEVEGIYKNFTILFGQVGDLLTYTTQYVRVIVTILSKIR